MGFSSVGFEPSPEQPVHDSGPSGATEPLNVFWRMPTDALLAALKCRREGLTSGEAASRIGEFGRNALQDAVKQRLLTKIAKRLFNPLIAILLVAATISGFTGDAGSFIIILAVIAISLTLDIVQENHAETAVDALRRSVAVKADVRRSGVTQAVPVEDVVPGDVVELRAGDLVPADGMVLEAHNTQVNEALMTGEPFPAVKNSA